MGLAVFTCGVESNKGRKMLGAGTFRPPQLPMSPPPAGFGTVAALPAAVGSFYVGAALVGVLFPLFIMLAADSSPKQRTEEGERSGLCAGRTMCRQCRRFSSRARHRCSMTLLAGAHTREVMLT